ncbi:MAG: hypothetical protein D6725_16405, partial [Planctomycetota bacterium]
MLKSLEIFGFKSFADRTRFEFPPGITCIVGPNGSGKSNVVDAVKWVLGDQSPKSLRGKEMTDVIFNGSANRKPAQFAEVILTFDNRRRFLQLDQDEVQVGRRLWRHGDAEYLLNGAAARLRDIRELFAGTGAGAVSYCVIEQGRVAQILQSNPTARRAVFEEAAGISRYRSRRTEALRRLERVTQNLQRLQDIVDEVESQLNATRSQAEKAATYRRLSDELRRWWVGLAADEFRALDAERRQLHTKLQQLEQRIQNHEQRLAQRQARLTDCEEAAQQAQTELQRLQQQWTAVREQVAAHTTTLRHLLQRLEELQDERLRLQRQIRSLILRRHRTGGRLHEARQVCRQMHEQCTATRRTIEELRRQEQELTDRRTHLLHRRDELVRRLADLRERSRTASGTLAGLQAQREQAVRHRDELGSRLDALNRRRDADEAAFHQRKAEEDRLAAELARTDREVAAIETDRRRLRQQMQEAQDALQRLREERSAVRARIQLLDEWEARDGTGASVRELLTRASLADHGPFAAMSGCLADHFEVSLEDAALVDVALGDRAQLILVRDWDAILRYLTRHSSEFRGRVGFTSPETVALCAGATADAPAPDDSRPTATTEPPERALRKDSVPSPTEPVHSSAHGNRQSARPSGAPIPQPHIRSHARTTPAAIHRLPEATADEAAQPPAPPAQPPQN